MSVRERKPNRWYQQPEPIPVQPKKRRVTKKISDSDKENVAPISTMVVMSSPKNGNIANTSLQLNSVIDQLPCPDKIDNSCEFNELWLLVVLSDDNENDETFGLFWNLKEVC